MADNKAKEWMGDAKQEANLPPKKAPSTKGAKHESVVLPDKNIVPHRGVYIVTWIILGFCVGIPALFLIALVTEFSAPENSFSPNIYNLDIFFVMILVLLAMAPFLLTATILIIIERAQNQNNIHLRNFLIMGAGAILLGAGMFPIMDYLNDRHNAKVDNEMYLLVRELDKMPVNENMSIEMVDLRKVKTDFPIIQDGNSHVGYENAERKSLEFCLELEGGEILYGDVGHISEDEEKTRESISVQSARFDGSLFSAPMDSCIPNPTTL